MPENLSTKKKPESIFLKKLWAHMSEIIHNNNLCKLLVQIDK